MNRKNIFILSLCCALCLAVLSLQGCASSSSMASAAASDVSSVGSLVRMGWDKVISADNYLREHAW